MSSQSPSTLPNGLCAQARVPKCWAVPISSAHSFPVLESKIEEAHRMLVYSIPARRRFKGFQSPRQRLANYQRKTGLVFHSHLYEIWSWSPAGCCLPVIFPRNPLIIPFSLLHSSRKLESQFGVLVFTISWDAKSWRLSQPYPFLYPLCFSSSPVFILGLQSYLPQASKLQPNWFLTFGNLRSLLSRKICWHAAPCCFRRSVVFFKCFNRSWRDYHTLQAKSFWPTG